MSKTIASAIELFSRLVTAHMSPARRAAAKAIASERLSQIQTIQTARGTFQVWCPSARSLHDPIGFGRDEPETIAWIDEHLQNGETLWDIGANIGLYTLYAALDPGVKVLAFEPGAASFANLVRNVELNRMGSRVSAYCIALSDHSGLDALHMANTESGHSMHAFGQLDTVIGTLQPKFSQAVIGYSVDDFRRQFDLPAPDHIKLDVDSIEAKILKGARGTLSQVKTVLVETYGAEREDGTNEIVEALLSAGFRQAAGPDDGRHRNELFVNKGDM